MGFLDFLKKDKEDGYTVFSPISGELMPLNEVEDKAFSSEIMGKGIAIIPSEGKLYAPASGKIIAFFPTGHAVGMETKAGVEIMMHVGLDTVNLENVNLIFTPIKKQGDIVKKGDLLLEFDIDMIKAGGCNISTPIIITNSEAYTAVEPLAKGKVSVGDKLIQVK